jgi:hypothetical protein
VGKGGEVGELYRKMERQGKRKGRRRQRSEIKEVMEGGGRTY